jgi:hypothetical protein
MTEAKKTSAPNIEEYKRRYMAKYTSKGRRYRGNVLIEGLPCYPRTRKALRQKLSVDPHLGRALLGQSAQRRRLALKPLARFFWAVPRVCELADHVWAEMLESYSRRKPYTAESTRIMQAMYLRAEGSDIDDEVQWVSAFTGIPGGGKTSAAAHVVNKLFQPLIWHPALDLWQIPCLRIQMPHQGKQGVSLAIAIIEAIDRRFPFGNYVELYVRNRATEPELMLAARKLLFIHAVGFLFVDDAQNAGAQQLEDFDDGVVFERPKRKKTPVTWAVGLLFQAAKTTQVPLMLVATSELEDVLGQTLSKLRLQYGSGMGHWGALEYLPPPGHKHAPVDLFLSKLWQKTLLRNHPALTDDMRNMFLWHTFGIPDFMVKLYYIVQWKMLQAGAETFTIEDVHRCARKYMTGLSNLAIKMNRLSDDDDSAKDELSKIPDLAREFGLERTIAGVSTVREPTFASAKKNSKALADPSRKAASRNRTASETRSDLPVPQGMPVSALEED